MTRKALIPAAELRRLADRLVGLQGRVELLEKSERATQLSHSSIEGGSLVIRDADGQVRGHVGMQSDGTSGVQVVNNPPPDRPNTPDLTPIMAGVAVTWNGDLITGPPKPGNFSHVNVYFGGSPDFIPGPSNMIGRMSAAGSIPVAPLPPGQYYAKLIAYNHDNPVDESEPSLAGGPAEPAQVVADDVLDGIVTEVKLAQDAVTEAKIAASAVSDTKIAAGAVLAEKIAAGAVLADKIAANAVTAEKIAALAVTADKVAANAIQAGHIEAGAVDAEALSANLVVAGTPGGNRVQINADEGIEQWLDGARTLWIPPNGNAEFQGRVRAGTEAQHIELVPGDETSFPRAYFLDDTSTRRIAQYYETDTFWLRREDRDPIVSLARGGQLALGANSHFTNYTDANPNVALGAIDLFGTGQTKVVGRNSAGLELGAWDIQASGHCFLTAQQGLTVDARGNPGGDLRLQNLVNNVWIEAGNDLNFDAGQNMWFRAENDLNLESDGAILLRANNDSGDSAELHLYANGETKMIANGNDLGGFKSFVIDHPDNPDRWLVHGCTESPMAGVEYWGEAEIVGGQAVVELPSYFESLTLPENRQVQLTPVDELCLVAASRIEDGRFTIRCSGPDGTRVSWLVKAERKDAAGFPVEPLKSEVTVRGDGPYRYLVK